MRIKLKDAVIFHSHPNTEKKLKIPKDRVIIDLEAFYEVIRILNDMKIEKKIGG